MEGDWAIYGFLHWNEIKRGSDPALIFKVGALENQYRWQRSVDESAGLELLDDLVFGKTPLAHLPSYLLAEN